MDTESRQWECAKCPRNTYSNGGGFSINGQFGEWTEAIKEGNTLQEMAWMKRACYKYSWYQWITADCEPCTASPAGDALECGNSTAKNTSVAFELSLKLYFVKKGKIEFFYKKDSTQEKDGFISGFFSFYVDDTSVIEDSKLNEDQNEWKYFSYDVFPGLREASFIYQKYSTDANEHMKLQIKELRVTGLNYADLEC